jgi:DNA-binding NtrC family response regulator
VDTKFGLEGLIGNSPALHEVVQMIKQVAPSKATVLIQGDSGTGKELVAHAIHGLSNRSKAKFVAVHCAALSPTLLESELFGHERGAFTGATERRIGRFEQANGGTLFLDEIGEIDTNTQVKILRVLGEEHSFERVGGNQSIRTDVRLIAATNKNLKQLVSEGKFRDDLYYRLNVVTINMPALRDRKEDIPLLVNAFLREFAKENGKPVRELTSEAMNCIEQYDWPGNVRELRTAVERGVVMSSGPKITLRDLPLSLRQHGKVDALSKNVDPARQLNLHETENRVIARALEETGGNVTEAARRLGISRRTVHRKLKELKESRERKAPDGN